MKKSIFLALMSLSMMGCFVGGEVVSTDQEEQYQPLYWEGEEVLYDSTGTPYVMVGAGTELIPHTDDHFDLYVENFRHHYAAYHRWYENKGYRAQYKPADQQVYREHHERY